MGDDSKEKGNGWIIEANDEVIRVCFNKTVTHAFGLWKAENALLSTLPLFFTQLALIMSISYLFKILFARLHQPRIVGNIIGGVILGPSMFGGTRFGLDHVFPFKSTLTIETMANVALIYYMFLLGLDVDFKPILHAGKKVLSIATAGILIPIPLGYLLYKLLTQNEAHLLSNPHTTNLKIKASMFGPIFWGITLATTNFAELAGVLADVKLLHSEIGRTALSISVITDLASWVLLVVTVPTVTDSHQLYIILASFALMLFFVFVLHPVVKWMVRNTNDICYDNYYDMDSHICVVLAGVLLFGYISDACGSHSMLGAFMWGAIIPKGELKNAIMEKVEGFVSNVMMPLFFLVLGMRAHFQAVILDSKDILLVLPVIAMAFLSKLAVTSVAALINKMPLRDSLGLGLVMNTKGLLSLIILNAGRDLNVLDHHTFAVMMAAVVLMTAAVGPLLSLIYNPNGSSKQYQHRSIRSIQPNSELRILTCIHSPNNVSGIINLLEASNPTKKSPISVFAVHLVELSGHASAMLIVHDTCNINNTTAAASSGLAVKNQKQSKQLSTPSNHIVAAFEKFETEREEGSVSVEALTTISSYSSMHQDICNLAEEKRVDLIIVPFHKLSTIDGGMENGNPSFRGVNKNLLENASCSMAIFVDRGLTDSSHIKNGHGHHRCAMLFIGGPDDREALAYAWRMASNPNSIISLTVVRFIVGKDAAVDSDLPHIPKDHEHNEDEHKNILKQVEEKEKEKRLDDQYIEGFVLNTKNQPSINLIDEVVKNGEETLELISAMGTNYELYIVGRGQSRYSPLTLGLSEWGDCPEIGPLGDSLVSSSFLANASILIVHQGAALVDELFDQNLGEHPGPI